MLIHLLFFSSHISIAVLGWKSPWEELRHTGTAARKHSQTELLGCVWPRAGRGHGGPDLTLADLTQDAKLKFFKPECGHGQACEQSHGLQGDFSLDYSYSTYCANTHPQFSKLGLPIRLRSGLWVRALQKVSKTLNFVSIASEKTTNYPCLIFKTSTIIRKSAPTRAVRHDERHK